MSKINYEYVISALAMSSITKGFSDKFDAGSETNVVNKLLASRSPGEVSFLYNAWTEQKFGEFTKKYHTKQTFADSGGLQITTLGLSLAEAKAEQKIIYKNQAHHSDIAMCFDEMAVRNHKLTTGAASRLDTSNRMFVREFVRESALGTADNIKEQIRVFDEEQSTSKIMLICQGNDLPSYKEYAETIVDELSDYELSRLYGIAPSGASNGGGLIERADMLHIMKELAIPEAIKANVHLLGVGSFRALDPITNNLDYFGFIDNLSFDSTSATRRYNIDGHLIEYGKISKLESAKSYIPKYRKIYDMYYDELPPLPNGNKPTLEQVMEMGTYFAKTNDEKIWTYYDRDIPNAEHYRVWLAMSVTMWWVTHMLDEVKKPILHRCNIYSQIKTYDDYLYYRKYLIQKYKWTTKKVEAVDSDIAFKAVNKRKETIANLF